MRCVYVRAMPSACVHTLKRRCARSTHTKEQHTMAAKNTRRNQPMPFSSVVQARANVSGKSADRVGKTLRAYIRGHNAELIDAGWDLSTHGKGDRYPDVPADVAQSLIDNGKIAQES